MNLFEKDPKKVSKNSQIEEVKHSLSVSHPEQWAREQRLLLVNDLPNYM
jgi:hypothetical protein